MENKKPWQSKTVVVNAIAGLALAVSPFIPQAHIVSDWIAANTVVIGSVWALANVVLRMWKSNISLGE